MTITITNNKDQDVMEGATLTGGSLTLTDTDPLLNPKIVKVTCDVPGVTFTPNGTNVVSYAGKWEDVFDRSIKYILKDSSKHTVTKFSDLPSDFYGLYAYIPPASNVKTVTVTFYQWNQVGSPPADLSTVLESQMTQCGTYTFTVNYDYAGAVTLFKNAIKNGSLYKLALSKGKVDE